MREKRSRDRTERSSIRIMHDALVHRSWDDLTSPYTNSIRVPLCYGRFISAVTYTDTDAPVTCVRCLRLPLDTDEADELRSAPWH